MPITRRQSSSGYLLPMEERSPSMWRQLNRMQDYLQHNLEDLPDISYRQVMPSANTSSDSAIGGLQRRNPQRILLIWAGLTNPPSPSSTFSQAVIPPLMKKLSISFHSPLEQQMEAGPMSPWCRLCCSSFARARLTACIILTIWRGGRGKEGANSWRQQSKGSYSRTTVWICSQKQSVWGYWEWMVATMQRWRWRRRERCLMSWLRPSSSCESTLIGRDSLQSGLQCSRLLFTNYKFPIYYNQLPQKLPEERWLSYRCGRDEQQQGKLVGKHNKVYICRGVSRLILMEDHL